MNFIAIGRTQKPHGVKGEIKLSLDDELFLEELKDIKTIFIEIKDKKLPYLLQSVRGGNVTIAKFEGISSPEQAMLIASKLIFVDEAALSDETIEILEEAINYEDYEGYVVQDATLGNVGVIIEIVEYPHQEMAIVNYKEKQVLIPMNEYWIKEADEKHKILYVDLPEGLLDL